MFFLYGFGWFYGRSAKWKSMENKFSLAFYHAINSVVLALTHAYKICPCRLHKQKIQAPSPPENKIKKSDCMCIKKCLLNAKLVIGAKTITDFLLIFFAFSSRSCRFVYVCVWKNIQVREKYSFNRASICSQCTFVCWFFSHFWLSLVRLCIRFVF